MGASSFFNNPTDYQTVDEGGEGSGFYEGPAYTEIDPVAIADLVAQAATYAAQAQAAASGAGDAAEAAASAAEALASKNSAVTAATVSVDAAGVATDQATIATTQAGIATTQAGIATTKAGEAATSASASLISATNADASEAAALASENAASTSASNAATSESNAAASASAAATSEANAASAASSAATTAANAAVAAAQGTAAPLMDGTAAVGNAAKWARENHVHPTDTSRADAAATTSALALKAPLASPALTGTPTAPTATASANTTQIATTAFVKTATTSAVAPKANLASPALTGTPTAPTAAAGTNTTQIATTAFAAAAVATRAPLASPALTGTPTAPTAAVGTNTTQVATTAFVLANAASDTPIGTISLTFDYYKEGGYDAWVNHMASRGLVGTYYVAPSFIDVAGAPTADNLLVLAMNGMEIGWYTNENMVTAQTSNRTTCFAKFKQAKTDLLAKGIIPRTLAANQRAWNTALSGMAYMSGWEGVRNAGTMTDQTWPIPNPWWVENGGTASLSSTDTLQALKDKLDATIAAKTWWIPIVHKVGSTPDGLTISSTIFDAFMAYVKTKKDAGVLRVCTFERGMKLPKYQ